MESWTCLPTPRDTQWLVGKVSGDYITHLEDIATIWQLLVSERFPIDSKQHMPDTHSVPLTEGNLGVSLERSELHWGKNFKV